MADHFKTSLPARWFRMYAEFATDPKVQMLSETDQRRYVMLLCLRCGNGDTTLEDKEVAFQLRIGNEEWAKSKAVLRAKELIDDDNKPTAWEKRQYASDSSTERVRGWRNSQKQKVNVTVTPPETEREKRQSGETDADALPPLTLAQKVAAELCLTGRGWIEAISGAIEFCVKYENKTADQAVEFLIARAKEDIDRGAAPNTFWFQERKWRKPAAPKAQPKSMYEDGTELARDLRERRLKNMALIATEEKTKIQ